MGRRISNQVTISTLLLAIWSSLCIHSYADQSSTSYLRANLPRPPVSNKIVNGVPVVDEYPWFVAPEDASETALCGGALIWPDIVLTAAHCDLAFPVDSHVHVGATRLWELGNATRRKIRRALPHPLYNGATLTHDFMLLQLNQPVNVPILEWNDQYSRPVPRDNVRTMGFGYDAETNGTVLTKLHQIDLKISSLLDCSLAYGYQYKPEIMICAGAPREAPAGACLGDSGGPLIASVGNETLMVGLVSFGIGCARPGVPGMYARTSGVVSWIRENTCILSANPSLEDCLPEWVNQTEATVAPTPNFAEAFEDIEQLDPDHEANLTLFLRYDSRPEETTWTIARDGVTLIQGPYSTPDPWEKVEYNFQNVPYGIYEFTIRDAYGDGMNYATDKGAWGIYQEVREDQRNSSDYNSTHVLIAGGDLDFMYSTALNFTVSENFGQSLPTSTPTFPPTEEITQSPANSLLGDDLDEDFPRLDTPNVPNDTTVTIYNVTDSSKMTGPLEGFSDMVDYLPGILGFTFLFLLIVICCVACCCCARRKYKTTTIIHQDVEGANYACAATAPAYQQVDYGDPQHFSMHNID